MTTEAGAGNRGFIGAGWARLYRGNALPIALVLAALLLFWYAMTVYLNSQLVIDGFERQQRDWRFTELVSATMSQQRPLLPAPHQVAAEMHKSIFATKISSRRSLVFHSWVTLASTLVGFALGTGLGVLLAVGIVHSRALDKSLLPWIIASQTIPILAIAPMIIVVLGALGLKGLLPKAIISTYLCFFPVAIGMVKGLRSPELLQLDLMRSYHASAWQLFWKLRWPASVPFLFASLKVAIAISLVGAIVGELPTGAQAGLGARLLVGSYYGQTVQIWAALLTAALLACCLVWSVGWLERLTLARMGAQPQ